MLKCLQFVGKKRKTYVKDTVIFEIGVYLEPEICYVVAIEGEKQSVDKVYKELKSVISED